MPPVTTERMDKASELAETIKTLSIDTTPPKVASRDPQIADSWEDDAAANDDEMSNNAATTKAQTQTEKMPYAPPPTPSSPSVYRERERFPQSMDTAINRPIRTASPAVDPERRPEKSTAVANRLIAGALGVRAPKRTEEQRKYDRAIKEQEIRRRNKEKEDEKRKQEEAEKAKAAIWDD